MNSANEDAIAASVTYWAEKLEVLEKREAFREALLRLVVREWDALSRVQLVRRVYLTVDYDPEDLLLEAVLAAGIECRGCLNSAEGIFPFKHRSKLEEGVFSVSEGRGGSWRYVYVRPGLESSRG